MTTSDTQVNNLIINTLTKAQYDSITPSATELYMVTDEEIYAAGTGIDSSALQNGTIQISTTVASKTDIGNADITIQRNGTAIGTINANATSASTINISVPTTATEVGALPDTTTIGSANTTVLVNSTAVGTINANNTTDGSISISVPTNTNQLTNGAGFITGISSGDVTTALGYTPVNPTSLATVATSGSYSDLSGTPTIGAASTTILVNSTAVGTINANQTSDNSINITTPTVNDATLTITQGGVSKGTFTANASSNVTIDVDATSASVDIDNITITKNLSDEIQTVAVIDDNNSSALKLWTGTRLQYESITVKDSQTLYTITDDSNAVPSRNIGEIIQSTIPLTDAGLHLLDGALISGSGSYSGFVTYIASLVSTYPDLFVTEATWQTQVTNYGVCGHFVYDSVNNTVRLPKIQGFTEGTLTDTDVGNITIARLPNITGTLSRIYAGTADGSASGAFNIESSGNNYYLSSSGTQGKVQSVSFDASRLSSVYGYGNTNTVKPQAIRVLYYIVIATSTKTDIQADIDDIATDLNGKADIDLTNLSNTGSIKIAHNAMPSDTYTTLTLGASGTEYLAPADGYVHLGKKASTGGQSIGIYPRNVNNVELGGIKAISYTNDYMYIFLPVRKGQKYRVYYSADGALDWFRFFYAVGSESESV